MNSTNFKPESAVVPEPAPEGEGERTEKCCRHCGGEKSEAEAFDGRCPECGLYYEHPTEQVETEREGMAEALDDIGAAICRLQKRVGEGDPISNVWDLYDLAHTHFMAHRLASAPTPRDEPEQCSSQWRVGGIMRRCVLPKGHGRCVLASHPTPRDETVGERAFMALADIVADPMCTPDAPRAEIQEVLDWLYGLGHCPDIGGGGGVETLAADVATPRDAERLSMFGATVQVRVEVHRLLVRIIGTSAVENWQSSIDYTTMKILEAIERRNGGGP